jgi:nitrogen-specific signal transduction histidine kinase/CheY-like chemotaxis protein
VGRDVTHLVRLEKQLRQAQKMEAIGTLAGGIAHDFNNILTIIIGYAEILLDTCSEDDPMRTDLQEVLSAGYRGRSLVEQILTFSRQTEQEQKPLQIGSVIKETLKLLRASIPKTVEIREDVAPEAGMVLADPTQIHQVLMNLCTNAAHAMREKGGELEVRLVDVNLDAETVAARYPNLTPGPYLRLTVQDTGHGMEREVMERIFDPFFTTKGPGEGTGLGLAMVYGIVRAHRGEITVYSEPGKGTTFNVFFPKIENQTSAETISPRPPSEGQERILFVDDEKVVVQMGRKMLERLGYQVTTSTDGSDALETFRSQPEQFDLVITDQTMPNMTGAELAQELMRIRPDIPVILCSGFSELIDQEKAKAMGIQEFIMKPLLMHEIAETIRNILDTQQK